MKKVYNYLMVILLPLGMCHLTHAQQLSVSGKVTDSNTKEGIAGANIVIKGTSRGTITDIDGNYSIEVEKGRILVVSFVSYLTEEIEVTSPTINIELNEDITNLEEVVISGLASSVKRSNLANAVATVSAEELVGTTGQTTIDGALYGKLTGVNITQSSGAPGGGVAMRLRGVSSIFGNNQPLFIIDGVYMNNSEIASGSRFASGANNGAEENASNRLADLDPNDIETIEVLKGPSAAAIYGTRANAGVVIITTKRGTSGRTRVSFSQDIGVNTILNKVGRRSFTADQVQAEFQSATDPDGSNARRQFEVAQAAGEIFDYEDEIFGEEGLILESRLSISGGDDKTKFYVGGSIRDEDGIVKNTGFNRRNIRMNLDHKLSDRIKITTSSSFINSDAARSFTGNENEGGLSYGYTLAFTRDWVNLFPDEFGNYPTNPDYPGNPLLTRDLAQNTETTNRLIQGLGVEYSLFSNSSTSVRLKFNGGIDYLQNETFVYVPEFQQNQVGTTNGFIAVGNNEIFNKNFQAFATFDKFLDNVTLSTQAGISFLDFDRDLVLTQTTQLIPGQTNATQGGAQQVIQDIQFEEEFGMILQQEANFNDKVILTAGVRLDKSSLNGDPNEFFAFPKASAAVNIANFDFWNSSVVNSLKYRVAYGETGNSPTFGALFTTFDATNINGSPGTIIGLDRGAPDLEPETAQEIETGIDAAFFDGQLSLTVSYYNKTIENLLYERQIPSSTGFTFQIFNDADLRNQGLEVALNARPVANSRITWNTGVNFWFNRSELTRLDGPSIAPRNSAFGTGLGSFFLEEGEPITQLKGNLGGELVTIGDVEPDFQFSWFSDINLFSNLDISFLLHWKEGGDNLNLTRLLTDSGNTTPRDIEPLRDPNFYIEDASYLRLRELAVYYTFPKISAFNNLINNLKVGASARNLFTITDYSSYDPEVSTKGGQGLSTGVEVTPFPSAKQYYFHLAVEF